MFHFVQHDKTTVFLTLRLPPAFEILQRGKPHYFHKMPIYGLLRGSAQTNREMFNEFIFL